MEPIGSQAEPRFTSNCDATEPELKRPKRSEDQRALEVFQEVCRRVPCHSRKRQRAELMQCRSQIRDKLDANRQRKSKWTTDAELAVLTKLWGCMARRVDRGFDFTYSMLKKGRTAEIYFSAKAVKRKLAELKAVLPAELYDFPAHTPADEMAVMLPMYQLLADATGCRQVSNGAASTLGLGLATSARSPYPLWFFELCNLRRGVDPRR